MSTLSIDGYDINGPDEAIRTYLEDIQRILASGETKLVRFAPVDDDDTTEVVLAIGPGVSVRAVVDRGEGIRPIGMPLQVSRQTHRRTGIITGA